MSVTIGPWIIILSKESFGILKYFAMHLFYQNYIETCAFIGRVLSLICAAMCTCNCAMYVHLWQEESVMDHTCRNIISAKLSVYALCLLYSQKHEDNHQIGLHKVSSRSGVAPGCFCFFLILFIRGGRGGGGSRWLTMDHLKSHFKCHFWLLLVHILGGQTLGNKQCSHKKSEAS